MTRAVIFDLMHAIDSLPDVMNALNAVLADWGQRPVVLDEARLMVGGGAEPLLERAFDTTGDALPAEHLSDCVDAFTAYYRDHPATKTTIFEGAVQALEALARKGMKLEICEQTAQIRAQVLEVLQLERHFEACFGKASVPFTSLTALRRGRAALGTDPDQSLYVGDSETDVETARNANVPIIMVSFGYSRRPAVELGGDRLINHFSELPGAVEELFSTMPADGIDGRP